MMWCDCLKARLWRLCISLQVSHLCSPQFTSGLNACSSVQCVGWLSQIAVGMSARIITTHRQLGQEC